MIIFSTYGRGNKYFQRTRRRQRVIDRTGLLPTLGNAGYSFPERLSGPAGSRRRSDAVSERLKDLERENQRLKKAVSENEALDKLILKEALEGKY